jgi:hypothetical protein
MIFLGETLPIPDDPGFFVTHPLHYGFRDRVILFSTLLAVVIGVLAWAIFIRKPHRRRRRHYHYPKHGNPASAPPTGQTPPPAGEPVREHSRHRHRRSRHNRTLNPTLAETRGLPPVRGNSRPPQP